MSDSLFIENPFLLMYLFVNTFPVQPEIVSDLNLHLPAIAFRLGWQTQLQDFAEKAHGSDKIRVSTHFIDWWIKCSGCGW